MGKDPYPAVEKSIELLNKAIQLSPENSKYFAMLGAAFNTKGAIDVDNGLDVRKVT